MKEAPITTIELYRLGFEEDGKDCWHNTDYTFQIVEQEDGSYMQYSGYTENTIGIPLMTVEQLQARHFSITGDELVYNDSEEPRTAQ